MPRITVTTNDGEVVWSENVDGLDLSKPYSRAVFCDELDIAVRDAERREEE